MQILIFNSGSSSLKTELVDTDSETSEKNPSDVSRASAIAHRVVHGGPDLAKPVRIDDAVLKKLEELEVLAPLHNAKAVDGIKQALKQITRSCRTTLSSTPRFTTTCPTNRSSTP